MQQLAEKLLARPVEAGSEAIQLLKTQAWEHLLHRQPPGLGQEAWKYTSLKPLLRRSFNPANGLPPVDQAWLESQTDGILSGAKLVFLDGFYAPKLSDIGELASGVNLLPISQHPRQANIVDDVNADDSWFNLAAKAGLNDGVVLEIDDDIHLPQAIHLLYYTTPGASSHLRCRVKMGRGAKASVIEHFLHEPLSNGDRNGGFCNLVNDIKISDGAQLSWCRIQSQGQGFLVTETQVEQQADSRFDYCGLDAQGLLVRHDIRCRLAQQQGQVNLSGVFLVDGKRHVANHVSVDHQAPQCSSDQCFKGIAWDRGRGVLNSKVQVKPGADGTNARQSSGNLLLSPHAEIDTKPELEIYADDVVASHGATVGQLDEQALFYLRSRGIEESAANALLIQAFCQAVLDQVSNPALVEYLGQRLIATLPNQDIS